MDHYWPHYLCISDNPVHNWYSSRDIYERINGVNFTAQQIFVIPANF